MNPKTPEERLRQAQRIVARYVPKDRDLVAELIAERRAEVAAERSKVAHQRGDLSVFDRPIKHNETEQLTSDDATTARAKAPPQTNKSRGGGK